LKKCLWQFFGVYLDLDFQLKKEIWTMVGLGLSFKNSGLDLDRKIWQSAHLWSKRHYGRTVYTTFFDL